jgi:aspartate/tyrosine/aromatic aminotransferase
MFNSLEIAPPDAILGLNEAFQRDSNPAKINLSVGVYKDEATKSYLGIDGLATYSQGVRRLLFGRDSSLVADQRACTIQTPGGTGALRVAADFLKQHVNPCRVWCSRPTWENHAAIFETAGVKVESYAYFDPATNDLDFAGMMRDLEGTREGDVVLLHGCCHNPSGVDPSIDQWRVIADLASRRKLVPLVDFAYQGLGVDIDADSQGLRVLIEKLPELIIASSFSKNFGLYRERVGALTAIAQDTRAAAAVLSQLKRCVRTNYSNPPAHGASIVSTILADQRLHSMWVSELSLMRDRINGMRTLLVAKMKEYAPRRDFSFIQRQRGMFSFSGLNRDPVNRLREEFAIYIVGSGRINVAGITRDNIDRLCGCLAQVLE